MALVPTPYLLVQLNNRVDPSVDAIDFGVGLVHKRPLPQIVNHAGRSAVDIPMAGERRRHIKGMETRKKEKKGKNEGCVF